MVEKSLSLELTHSQKRILEILAEKKEADVAHLASELGVKTATIRKYALTLEKMGLVKRVGNIVRITDKGIEVIGAKEEKAEEVLAKEAEEVAKKKASIPFIFFTEKGFVPLKASSLEQLAAIVYYKLVEPEDIEWVVKGGYLSAWLKSSLNAAELAEKIDALKGLSAPEIIDELSKMLKDYLK
jgi:DNA-binding MarR family transcriptional regulator